MRKTSGQMENDRTVKTWDSEVYPRHIVNSFGGGNSFIFNTINYFEFIVIYSWSSWFADCVSLKFTSLLNHSCNLSAMWWYFHNHCGSEWEGPEISVTWGLSVGRRRAQRLCLLGSQLLCCNKRPFTVCVVPCSFLFLCLFAGDSFKNVPQTLWLKYHLVFLSTKMAVMGLREVCVC